MKTAVFAFFTICFQIKIVEVTNSIHAVNLDFKDEISGFFVKEQECISDIYRLLVAKGK